MNPMNSTPYCPSCNKPATGSFCQHCGTKLGGKFCNQCGSKLSPNAAFCNKCGTKASGKAAAVGGERAVAAASTFGGQNLPWWIAGFAMFGLIVVVGTQMVQPAGPVGAPQQQMGSAGGTDPNATSSIDLASMTPRQAADRLYTRVMQSVSDGDTASALGFQPMAVQAYQIAEPLDVDGLFHQSLLERLTDPAAALVTAKRALQMNPDHLLGLLAAAEAAGAQGLTDEGAGYFTHLLEVFDAQVALQLDEYVGHEVLVNTMRGDAEAFLAGR